MNAPALLSPSELAGLRLPIGAIPPETPVDEAADLFLRPEYAQMLCLPVVEQERPVGTISRHVLNGIFLRRFGREIFGQRPVSQVMNTQPLIVDLSSPLEAAAQYITAQIGSPLTEDFIMVEDGRYAGMGVVLDLLRLLRERVAASTRQLSEAFNQLKSSQAALVQNEKMASLGQMVAGVAHEINTPLGYVRNNVEMAQGVFGQVAEALRQYHSLGRMLVDDGADEQQLNAQLGKTAALSGEIVAAGLLDETAALFKDTLFGVDQIKDLVINLRNFSRLDQSRVAAVSLNDCLDQTLSIANNLIKGRVSVIRRYGELPLVSCSPSQINQVLLNLITNGVQAIEHDQGKLLLKTEADGDWARISVQDNGKGIAPEHLQKIFDPFFTTKPVGHGTGLGLSISYQIIQAHGGSIQVVSKPGQGTKFLVSLPLKPVMQEAA